MQANARDSLCGDASDTAFVVFKARAARREKDVELRRLDFETVAAAGGLPVVNKRVVKFHRSRPRNKRAKAR